uniref:hypothetical protein n=1 Tax=Xenorhabdus bovienii TaxID=40576 RepID=UPI0021586D77
TAIADGYDFTIVLIKTREGRPIFVHNNKEAKVNGIANARVNASVLSLYDNLRVKAPQTKGEDTTWSNLDADAKYALDKANKEQKQIVVLTH